ncbi:hypothetical protein M1K46_22675 [Fictibacillus sp. WQ 8-8]|uniref:hypothetical protein n=1 Tax=Fictibacillus sp. WQ 8-8 TaxID=2938788 RepID=UPI00210DEADF|nr:hypothetical protein [Fictibacillus sp. WQ 8-8]MCQ6268395.1 hypothetical protein [Fictibacillus sp. WQ 8-8]
MEINLKIKISPEMMQVIILEYSTSAFKAEGKGHHFPCWGWWLLFYPKWSYCLTQQYRRVKLLQPYPLGTAQADCPKQIYQTLWLHYLKIRFFLESIDEE